VNILISQSRNIKLIDCSLPDLHNPVGHLSLLYSAAEVDVRSFDVVLYVLVCGKVQFDDTSMLALHAKIKHRLVEYPVWPSAQCEHGLLRTLITNPAARAPLPDILGYP
jgi:hypothetical protein